MTIILRNNVPVAYAKNLEEAHNLVINKVYGEEKGKMFNGNWKWACGLSNCGYMYSFKEVSKEW